MIQWIINVFYSQALLRIDSLNIFLRSKTILVENNMLK